MSDKSEAAASLSVVICAYNDRRWDDLRRAVFSVCEQRPPAVEVIVVIDHNTRLFERARAAFRELPTVTVLESDADPGLSGARNVGVTRASAEVVAFMDDDAVASARWLEFLTRHYADPLVVGVGGAIHPRWVTKRPRSFPPEFDWVVGCTYRGLPERTQAVRNMIGANMSFRRPVFDLVGGFRSDIGRIGTKPLGGEETELCLRVRARLPSSRIVYEPLAVVEHVVPAERGTWSYFVSRCYSEGWSKARVSQLAGRRDGLETERRYVTRTLPQALTANLRAVFVRRDLGGLGRATRVVVGVLAATGGYAAGMIRLIGTRAGSF